MLESLECIKKLELCFKNKRMKDQNSEEMNEGNIPALLGSNFKAICLFCFYEILSCKGIYVEMLWSQVFWWMNERTLPLIHIMDNGGVNTTVSDTRLHWMGQMADFPPLLASSVFDL